MGRKVIIIGGGASGMMAAIHAARAGADVTILEHMDRVGKKLLSTGNGRCNLTNLYQAQECYRCGLPGFPEAVLGQFSMEQTLEFFKGLGILPKSRDGYIYPNSDQASAVLEVLQTELAHLHVRVVCGCQVKDIRGPLVRTSAGEYPADAVILAAGSKAAPVTGSDGSGYELARRLGHTVVPPLPALTALKCREKHYKQLAGIRTDAGLTLYANGKELAAERGELQLTDYGISGIPVFQISRYGAVALSEGQCVTVRIDYLPGQSLEETKEFVADRVRTQGYKTCEEWMTGLLNKKLAAVLLKLAGIHPEEVVSQVRPERWKELVKQLKAYQTEVMAVNPYEKAQVCCGGVDTREIDPETMESKLVKNLYLTGELVDVDGICGGYNLQWAWSSGAVAGRNAGTERGQL